MDASHFSTEEHDMFTPESIAVIGMSCTFPGASNIRTFWNNIRNGIESVSTFDQQTLLKAGVPQEMIDDPSYIPKACVIENIDQFDAEFFGFSPHEAAILDPQQRIFLECVWNALEESGYAPGSFDAPTGIFAGTRLSTYLYGLNSVPYINAGSPQNFQELLGNDKDYLASRISYKLNLKGPSVTVQSACSTSLVAVHLACESLKNGETDMAIAGGAAIVVPQNIGFLHHEGMILSPDGCCRPFDANANGTTFGNGSGAVVLKRLADAEKDGDTIWAVIKGSAVNNDGSRKAGYTAPGMEGQMGVIQESLEISEVPVESISYIETHGTGTPLGDPIEIEALTRVYRQSTTKKQFCKLGSVKANIGHLDSAAGIASFIKTVLALKNKEIPPTPNFVEPNPAINFSSTPFQVCDVLTPWTRNGSPRRAGVSSFGIGGTNAHIILEESPEQVRVPQTEQSNLFVLSAKNEIALQELAKTYARHLLHTNKSLEDICFTSREGRAHFSARLAIQAVSTAELQEKLEAFSAAPAKQETVKDFAPVFLFTGQGSQYSGMGKELYSVFPEFKKHFDACADHLDKKLNIPLTKLVFDSSNDHLLQQTQYAQPALFALEYSLARTWMEWGIQPAAMLGHSLGEYVAATLAGVFTLEDALTLVVTRACLMHSAPGEGAMVAVFTKESTLNALLHAHTGNLSIAALNAPTSITVSGSKQDIHSLCDVLAKQNISYKELTVSHAFHSHLMEPILEAFEKTISSITLHPPKMRYISNLTGEFVVPSMVTTPGYWKRHMRETVQFAKGVETLMDSGLSTMLEIGPHPVLCGLVGQCAKERSYTSIISMQRKIPQQQQLIEALGAAYTAGATPQWKHISALSGGGRIPLPTYAFQRKRHWAAQVLPRTASTSAVHTEQDATLETIFELKWKPAEPFPTPVATTGEKWLLAGDAGRLAPATFDVLTKYCTDILRNPGIPPVRDINANNIICVISNQTQSQQTTFTKENVEQLYTVTNEIRELVETLPEQNRLIFVLPNAQAPRVDDPQTAMQAAIWSILRTIRKEYPQRDLKFVDMPESEVLSSQTVEVLLSEHLPVESAIREGNIYVPHLEKVQPAQEQPLLIRKDGTYLITGGTGGVGLALAEWLAFNGARKICLISRSTPNNTAQAAMKMLSAVGADIAHYSCDIGNEKDVQDLFAKLAENQHIVRGVFHLAGTTADTTKEQFTNTLLSKGAGAFYLHNHAPALDLFVLFSSTSSHFGPQGHTAYSAANACLDALAQQRFTQDLPVLTVNWGAWDAGMSERPGIKQLYAAEGIKIISLRQGLQALELLLQSNLHWATVMDVNGTLFDGGSIAVHGLISTPGTEDQAPAQTELLHSSDQLRNHLAQEIRQALKLSQDEPAHDADLISLGLDSLMFLGLSQSLSRTLGFHVGPNELFSHSTVARLADRLMELGSEAQEQQDAIVVPHTIADSPDDPFALSDIQYAYWIGRNDGLELGRVACHTYFELEIENLDISRFEQAWNKLIKRHAMLRCYFRAEGKQQILPVVPPYVIACENLQDASSEKAQHSLTQTRDAMSHLVHNASRWPLFEIRASHLANNITRIHVSFDLLIADFHSITILMRELNLYYEQENPELPTLEFTFKEYIQCEQESRQKAAWQSAKQYWNDRLATLPSPPPLPLAKRLSDIQVPKFSRCTEILPKDRWEKLKSIATSNGLTPSCLLMAVYGEVLRKWSSADKFCINLTLFNRRNYHNQVNDIIGDFTSVTLMEVDGSGTKTFLERAARLQKQLWNDLEHRQYNGVQVIRDINSRSGGSLGATMPVVFTANISGSQTNQLDSLMGELVHSESQTPQVWLDHQVFEQGGDLVIMWDHVTGLFPDGMVEAMFKSNVEALTALAESNSAWTGNVICQLPHSQIASRQKVNATDAPKSEALMHSLFVDQLAKHSSRVAVHQGNTLLSYDILANRAAQLAAELTAKGVGRGNIVAISMNKGWEQVVAALGILFAGAAYVPISPDLPEKRRHYLATETEATNIVTQPGLAAQSWPEGSTLHVIDSPDTKEKFALPKLVNHPDDLAYVIFTSGSTGNPKGVMISHRGAVNTILDINQRFNVREKDRILALSDLSFDLSVYDIFGALAAGAAIVMPDPDMVKEPKHWRELTFKAAVTIWNSAPALMRMLTEYAEESSRSLSPTLRLALLSGDWIPTDIPRRLRALSSQCDVISLGGATEASIWSILHPVSPEDENRQSIPYGRPMVNQRFHVLDTQLQPSPDGVPGSLYIEGDGLALGYLNNEEKTAESFITHPQTNTRLYKTGDLGRYMPDGTIEFLGREDFQVKIRGHRIEPGEIESALTAHPQVTAAIVLAAGETKGDRRLIAYVQTDMDEAQVLELLPVHLEASLPKYMMPSAYIALPKLPVTNNGKIDRKALPVPEVAIEPTKEYVAPSTDTEQKLLELWEEMLERSGISVTEDFFAAGGDSLIAARLVLRIRKAFEQEIPLTSIFENSTITSLAAQLDANSENAPSGVLRTPKQLSAFAVLPEDIVPGDKQSANILEQETVFLTGVTGYLGASILEVLLQQPNTRIQCLVRSDDGATGMKRLEETLHERGISVAELGSRVTIVPGDLEQPCFGLSADSFAQLAAKVNRIIHCGARVQYVYPYESLANANVNGTIEVLRLATNQGRNTHLTYISTSAVISPAGANGMPITEETALEFEAGVFGGYPQSKWVAEKLVRMAAKRGLSTTVFRPGTLWGDTRTGYLNREDFPSRLAEACLLIGCAPDFDIPVSVLPVNIAAQAIVALSSHDIAGEEGEQAGQTWNLLNPEMVSFKQCISAVQDLAAIDLVPYTEWRSRLAKACAVSPSNPLTPLLPMIPMSEEEIPHPSTWDLHNLRIALEEADIVATALDSSLIKRCVNLF